MFVYPYLKEREIKYKGKSLKLGEIPMDFCPTCKNFKEEEIIPHCSISSEPIEVYVGEKKNYDYLS